MGKYGLLMPHLGEHADRDRLLEGAQAGRSPRLRLRLVRDHLVFEPHGEMEKPNRTSTTR